MTKPSIPQGTRDFGPETVRKRNYIFNIIRVVFELYGFQPLETPAMETNETLMGKYGEEGDKLIFRVLESGMPFKMGFIKEFLSGLKEFLNDETKKLEYYNKYASTNFDLKQVSTDLEKADLADVGLLFEAVLSNDVAIKKYVPKFKAFLSEKALKYDLTIPFARYVAMNHNQLTFPFKRYQIQPVWRADRPQKGRYREFYQCDADVVGSNSLLNEVELAIIYATVFEKLGIDVEIKVNSRKILKCLADYVRSFGLKNRESKSISNKSLEETEEMLNISMAIDKLDKIGIEGVKKELEKKGLDESQIRLIESYLLITGNNNDKIDKLKKLFQLSSMPDELKKGIEEVEYVFDNCQPSTANCQLDLTLARGLNYYTGIIFEVKANNVQMGSIGGGGRYDDLTGLFGVPNIPGVGISFGVDRIYDVMEELKLFPEDVHTGTQVLFFNLGENESKASFTLMQELRAKGIRSELFHENSKFDKQFKYAEKKGIPYAVIIGSKELENKTCIIKDLRKGEQQIISVDELSNFSFI